MKTITLISCLLFTSGILKSQSFSFDDIIKTNKVYFYGYDFTHFKFVEPKRIGRDAEMKAFLFEFIQYMNEKRTEKYYRDILSKDSVVFTQESVNQLNSKIRPENIMATDIDAYKTHHIPKDSLQNIINRYAVNEKSGIGFVQIMQCFDKNTNETLLWFAFFDISTKNILDVYEASNNSAASYHGLAAYWALGVSDAVIQFRKNHYMPMVKRANKNR